MLFERGIFTSEAVPVTLSCEELCTDNDDTCDGHGHTVGRPVMGMGGGTINPMEQSYQLPSDCLVERKVNTTKSALSGIERILSVFIWFDHLEENYEHQKNYVC